MSLGYTISDLAKISGTDRRTVQYWADSEVLLEIELEWGGRRYHDIELKIVQVLRQLMNNEPSSRILKLIAGHLRQRLYEFESPSNKKPWKDPLYEAFKFGPSWDADPDDVFDPVWLLINIQPNERKEIVRLNCFSSENEIGTWIANNNRGSSMVVDLVEALGPRKKNG